MPRVVSQVEESNPMARSRSLRSWRVSPELFPCDLPAELQQQADKAVEVSNAHFVMLVAPVRTPTELVQSGRGLCLHNRALTL